MPYKAVTIIDARAPSLVNSQAGGVTIYVRSSLGSRPSRYALRRFLIASVNCAAVRGRETVKTWKAWDDTSRGDRQEVDKRSRAAV